MFLALSLKNSHLRITIFCLIAFVFISCTAPLKNNEKVNDLHTAKLIKYELFKTLTIDDIEAIRTTHLEQFLNNATMPYTFFEGKLESPKYAVKLYKVTYHSSIPEQNNKPVITTGLIAIPDTDIKELPLISYQHGTIFDQKWAPSAFDIAYEVHFMVSQFASQGYVLIAADYFGLEEASQLANSYLVESSSGQACMDMYHASLEVLEQEGISKNNFFLSGWSQGGYNTMVFLRMLERQNIPVTAAFTAAAPVDPLLSISRGLFNPRAIDAHFLVASLSNLIFSMEETHQSENFSSRYIQKKYYQTARNLFDFKISFEQFADSVPINFEEVFTEEFFKDAKLVTGPFWPKLSQSEAYKWISITPLKSFGGGLDEAVPVNESFLGIEYMRLLGKKDAEAILADPNADHRCTYIYSLIAAKPWLDEF
jgi:hypothetical protein